MLGTTADVLLGKANGALRGLVTSAKNKVNRGGLDTLEEASAALRDLMAVVRAFPGIDGVEQGELLALCDKASLKIIAAIEDVLRNKKIIHKSV